MPRDNIIFTNNYNIKCDTVTEGGTINSFYDILKEDYGIQCTELIECSDKISLNNNGNLYCNEIIEE